MRRTALISMFLAAAVVSCGYVVSKFIPIGCPTALLKGLLIERDGELVVTSAGGDVETKVETKVKWPFGWSVHPDGETLVVTGLLGDVKAREGDGIEAGGGMVDVDRFGICGDVLVTVGAGP